jgi:hypothetical protein
MTITTWRSTTVKRLLACSTPQQQVEDAPLVRDIRSGFLVARPAGDYTPRVIPNHPAAIVPLEAAQIVWQR